MNIKEEVDKYRGIYEAALKLGQPVNWNADQRTKDIWCIGKWMNGYLPESRRIELLWYFNRIVRSEQDPFDAAQKVIDKFDSGAPLEPQYQKFTKR